MLMKVTMTNIIERQGARFIYTNGKKIAKQFNIQKYRHLAKSKAICVTFYIKEARYFMVCNFSWNFSKLAFMYKKYDT